MSPRPSTRGCADGMTCGEWRAYTRAWAGFNPLRATHVFLREDRMPAKSARAG